MPHSTTMIVAKVAACWLISVIPDVIAQKQGFNPAVLGNIKESVASAVVSRQDSFVVTLELGTPVQELKCLVDSGSADLWVPSKRCANCGQGGNHFFADASSTFSPMKRDGRPVLYSVSYGSGEVAGFGAQESLTLGPWTIKNQSFIIVEDQKLPRKLEWDGIFGLGWKGIAHTAKPVYKRMQEAGHPAMFSLIPKKNRVAKLVLGQVPDEIKTSTLVWTPCEKVLSDRQGNKHLGFWVVSAGVAITLDKPRPEKFLVDTGTNQMLLVPSRFYLSFVRSLIPPSTFHRYCGMDASMGNVIVCDCHIGQNSSSPPLRLYLGGRQFLIPLAELFRKVPTNDGSENLCMLQVQPNDAGAGSLDGMLGGLLGGMMGGGMQMPMPMPPLMQPQQGIPEDSKSPPEQGEQPPIPLQGLMPGIGNSPGAATRGIPNGEEVEEIMERLPNGTVCTTTVVEDLKSRQKKVKKICQQQRRLQQGVAVIPLSPQGGFPMRGLPMLPIMEIPLQENPIDELWVLGGVFMEKFVTIFDFDKERVGFAELTTSVADQVSTRAVIRDFKIV